MSDVVHHLQTGTPVPIRCPNAVRPWQHVLEALAGYLTLASRLLEPDAAAFCGAWNFGPDDANCETVGQVVERMVQAWGSGGWVHHTDVNDPPEANVLRLSSALAADQLGWRSYWGIAEVVERTIEWYRRYANEHASARDACLADIAAYTRSLEAGRKSPPALTAAS